MKADKIQEIEAITGTLLQDIYPNGNIEIPVRLDLILKKNNIKLTYIDLKEQGNEVAGFFVRSDNCIYVSTNDSFPRTAFTIAHELGHFILHKNSVDQEILYRKQADLIDQADIEVEKEANWFAASILMPRNRVILYWELIKDMNKTAALFGVSITAMYWRLKNIGINTEKIMSTL